MARYEWNTKYVLKTDNVNLVVDLIDMKDYLKIDNTADDVLITSLIKTATSILEKHTRRELLNKTFNMYLDFFPFYKRYGNSLEENFDENTILVKRSKLQSILNIKFYNNQALETLDSSLYDFTRDNDYSRIYLISKNSSWPQVDSRKQSVNIEFVAGYGVDDTFVPEELKTTIKTMVAFMYENRGDCASLNKFSEILGSATARRILDQYIILGI